MIPDIEFVLGLVGSTIGNVVCILLPSVIFVRLNQRNTTERLAAQAIFFVGLFLMVVTTYVTLHMADSSPKVLGKDKVEALDNKIIVDSPPLIVPVDVNEKPKVVADPALLVKDKNEARVEPVEPHAPKEVEEPVKEVKEVKQDDEKESPTDLKAEKEKESELKAKEEKADKLLKELEKQKEEHKQIIEEQKEVLDRMKQHLEADETQDQEKGNNQNNLVPAPPQQVNAGAQGQQNIQQPYVQNDNLNQANLQEGQQQPQPNVPLQQNIQQFQNQQNPKPQQNIQQQQNSPILQNAPQPPQQQHNSPQQQVFQQQNIQQQRNLPQQNLQQQQPNLQQQAQQPHFQQPNHLNLPLNPNIDRQPFAQDANDQNSVQGVQAQFIRGQEQVNPPSQQIGQKQEVNLRAPQLKKDQGQVGPGFKALPSMNQRPLQQPQNQGQPVAESSQVINKSSENHKDFKRAAQEKVGRDLKHFATNF